MANPIATARKALGMTQAELAAAVGVTRGALSQYEMEEGTEPAPRVAARLSAVLGIPLETIYGVHVHAAAGMAAEQAA